MWLQRLLQHNHSTLHTVEAPHCWHQESLKELLHCPQLRNLSLCSKTLCIYDVKSEFVNSATLGRFPSLTSLELEAERGPLFFWALKNEHIFHFLRQSNATVV